MWWWLVACTPAPSMEPPADLPEAVWLKTQTETFNARWWLALREGRIWAHPNPEDGRDDGGWRLLGATGLPEGSALVRFDPPSAVASISADGTHLQAVSAEGVFYRAADLRRDVKHLRWTDRWGAPAARGPGIEEEWPAEAGWAVSDSHPFNVRRYEDVLGISHAVGLGVAHVYRLGPEGRSLHLNDWWLPADWSREVCLPERGTFQARSLAASASTLFVVGDGPRLYTRLYDLDTAGENTLLTYSYVLDGPSGTTRALPAEPWAEQPLPDGEITDAITIFQDGRGNAARVLRVEGVQGGRVGVFEKRLFDATWDFIPTDPPLLGSPLAPRLAATPPAEVRLVGALGREGVDATVEVAVVDFHLVCSPARAVLSVDGAVVTVGGEPVAWPLHHVLPMRDAPLPTDWAAQGLSAPARAALLVPVALDAIDDPVARARLTAILGDRPVINLIGEAGWGGLTLDEITPATAFGVPRREKGRAGERVWLRVARAEGSPVQPAP